MEKIFQIMSDIPKDKLLHNLYGTLIYLLFSVFDENFSILYVIAIAVLKEVYDEYRYNGFDSYDILATIAIPLLLYLKHLFF